MCQTLLPWLVLYLQTLISADNPIILILLEQLSVHLRIIYTPLDNLDRSAVTTCMRQLPWPPASNTEHL